MTAQQTPILNIGDKIGFVILAQDIDDRDKTVFFPVVEITARDGERAYRYQFPDGTVSRSAIRQSALTAYALQIEPQVATKMLNLTERRGEFVDALNRSKSSNLEVYDDFDKDAFAVVNKDNGTEYRVKLKLHKGQLFGECECQDFTYRKRVCKHLSEVLIFAVFTVKNPVPRYWQAAFGAAAAQQSYAPTK
jgi:hypothetical protein